MIEEGPVKHDFGVTESFFKLYDRMIGDVDIPSVLRDVADVVCRTLNAERATVYLIDRETNELQSVAAVGNVSRMIRIPIRKTSLAGFCAATGRAFVVGDAYGDLSVIDEDLSFDRTWDELNGFRTRDVMCAPAIFKDEVLGVVQVLNSQQHPFRHDDLPGLCNVARLVGYALYHARLYDDIATLKRLEKEKAEFMRVMVHELKSPVAAATMMTNTLKRHHENPQQINTLTGRIAGRMEQLGDLIKDILDLASVKSGNPLGEITIVDMVETAKSACASYRDQAEQKGLEFLTDLTAQPLPVRIDVRGCEMVLSNLVSNAVKYTEKGSVEISLKRHGPWAVFAVRDTGMGIPQADVPRLFREFFRAANAKRSRVPGSGVGLAGVKRIVERFDGELTLESCENEGSTFTIHVPLHEEGSE